VQSPVKLVESLLVRQRPVAAERRELDHGSPQQSGGDERQEYDGFRAEQQFAEAHYHPLRSA
jgi:hypothetical protein